MKARKTETITIRIDKESKEEIMKWAEAMSMSQSEIIITAFTHWIHRPENEKNA